MAYRNKTFVSFASEDIDYYRMMCAWRDNARFEFDFHDAHDLNTALDTSQPETIRRRLGERLANTKQVVMLISDTTKPKAARPSSFIHYEVEAINRLGLPVVFVNLNKSRGHQTSKLPTPLLAPYTISVPFGVKIVQYALDHFPEHFAANKSAQTPKQGPHHYVDSVYDDLAPTDY